MPSLEKTYTAFGRALTGMEAIRAIKTGEPVPDPQDKMITVGCCPTCRPPSVPASR
jgi:peptidylprolyl isomerase